MVELWRQAIIRHAGIQREPERRRTLGPDQLPARARAASELARWRRSSTITPWLVAPDFAYGTNAGEPKTLKDHRGTKIVLLVMLNLQDTEERLKQLDRILPQLQSSGVEIIIIPNLIDQFYVADKLPGAIVSEGGRKSPRPINSFARSFNDENPVLNTPHVEYLIDSSATFERAGCPRRSDAWRKSELLMAQVDLLRKGKPRAPAPDDHVHSGGARFIAPSATNENTLTMIPRCSHKRTAIPYRISPRSNTEVAHGCE